MTKLTPAGSALVYSTYLGGSGWDHGLGIAVDQAGSAYVTGETDSTNFPTQSAYQATRQGMSDAFVTKLTFAGNALIYSTYLGGSNVEVGRGIAVDGASSAYVTGTTYSTNFPTQSAYQQTYHGRVFDGDAFVTRLPSLGASLSIAKTHIGNFAQGQSAATYTVTVWNAGSDGTTGTVTVTDTIPPGLTLVSMAGAGWACSANTCTRGNALSPGFSYPPITVTVNVAANAPASVTNAAAVSGGGAAQGASVNDVTAVTQLPTYTISGQVTKGGGALFGVTVLLAGGAGGTRTTDSFGNYSFTSLPAGGNYTVTPTLVNHSFTPASAAFNSLQTNQLASFIAQTVSNSPPTVGSVSPAAGATATQAFTFSFTDPNGWQDLGVVNILVNFWLDGRNSCYVAYRRPSNTLYLINNAGDGYAGSMALNGSGTLGNSQCIINGAGSSVSGAGNTMSLTLNMTFPASFAGAKIIYTAARDVAESNSCCQRMGIWEVPGAVETTTTAVAGMSPARGSGTAGTFTFIFTDTVGANDLGVMNILMNDWLDGRHACYLAYARGNNTLYLMNDNGDALLPGLALNGSGNFGNSQCTVNGVGSSVASSGNTLTLTLNMTFGAGFSGNRVFYLAARDVNERNNTGWQAMGSWTVR